MLLHTRVRDSERANLREAKKYIHIFPGNLLHIIVFWKHFVSHDSTNGGNEGQIWQNLARFVLIDCSNSDGV